MANEREFLASNIEYNFFTKSLHGHTCLHGKLAVGADGLVRPCVMYRFPVGTWQDVQLCGLNNVMNDIWHLTKDKIEGCRDCAMRYACFDCRVHASSIYGHPQNCNLAKELL